MIFLALNTRDIKNSIPFVPLPMPNNQFSVTDILSALDIDALNEMQLAALDATENNNNIIIISNTGSGKTLAFLLPLLRSIDAAVTATQAMIIVPSRELALQIDQVLRSMRSGYKITCCYGGHKREIEENNLIQAPTIIIGTPGRLADHIRRGNIKTEAIHTLILDEFDKSLEMGFTDEVSFVVGSLKAVEKRILTSATEGAEIPAFIGATDALKLNYSTGEEVSEEILSIKKVKSPEIDKSETLFKLLCYIGDRSSIIFCNHREAVERTSAMLADRSITNTFYHGAMEQHDRETALAKFRNGSINFLITTDLASRGLDVPNIRYVIHYDLPATEDIFTHRNGRTARMDASGTVILIMNEKEYMPRYITTVVDEIDLPADAMIPEKPKWATLFINAGKKDKINKIDIVGFLSNKGQLKKEDIGLIEVKDFFSFVAVRRSRASHVLQLIKDEKMKNKKVKIAVAK
jgi:superfamily II DNA/RNA helicase